MKELQLKDIIEEECSFETIDGIYDENGMRILTNGKMLTEEEVKAKIAKIPRHQQIPYRIDVLVSYKFKTFVSFDEKNKWMVGLLNTGLNYFAAYKSHINYWVSCFDQ